VIVSRGELVEIGGSFRIPDVMAKSGSILKEVGTTNRTHLKDYENAIAEDTALLLKVHRSNYSVIGFTAEVALRELVELGAKHGLPVQVSAGAWRTGIPVYDGDSSRQIGKATSGTWSPIIKKNLALASVENRYAQPGRELKIEHTVEYQRETVSAVVASMPFYNPEHKKL
jgi:hypothetical protein